MERDFSDIYTPEEGKKAHKDLKVLIMLYAFCALFFLSVVTIVLLSYKYFKWTIYFCFPFNVLLTAAFVIFSIFFIREKIAKVKQFCDFLARLDSGDKSVVSAVFRCCAIVESSIKRLTFESAEGVLTLDIPLDKKAEFTPSKGYYLQVCGDALCAYKEQQ